MGYVIYLKEYSQIPTNNIIAPRDFEFKIWEPSTFRLYPKGINGKRKLDFILTWILYFFLSSGRKKFYRVFLLLDGGKVIHHSVVTTKSFKYLFMGENDLQIGMIFTQSEFRRKGLASYMLDEILRRYETADCAIWYITRKDNLASRKFAEKLGFSEYADAVRKTFFLLGRYIVVPKKGKEKSHFDYSLITESPGLKATKEQVERLYQRYHFATQFAAGKCVLEIGCGAGLGLGYLSKIAKKVVGGDIEEKNIALAREYYRNRGNITTGLMDAHNIPFPDKSFDLVLLYETIYYLKEPKKFVSEAQRLLRENGALIICTVNKDWEDFHPSPFTYKYFSVGELYDLLKDNFRDVKLYGGVPIGDKGARSKIISLIKRFAVKFNLIPGSLNGRSYLKRMFIGRLIPLPNEIYEGMAPHEPPLEVAVDEVNRKYKILYAVGKK